MRFKNLLKLSCLITLCVFTISVNAQNVNTKVADTTRIGYGYGEQPKKSVTGAVAASTPENFNQGAIFNPVDQLAGKIAGLTISETGGDPNQTASMNIRGQSSLFGNSSPLIVVDGVILADASQFQNIPPDNIASYTVLKDASAAAIYGLRGAHGAIIVTTKRGVAGRPVVSYTGLIGSSIQSKYYDLLNAAEYKNAISQINGSASIYDKGANTDWQKAIGRTGIEQRNSLSLSGGSNSINYLGGVDYQNQQGIIQNNGKEQLGLQFNAGLKTLADKLDLKAGVQYVNTTRKFTDYSIFSYVPNAPPTYPVKNPDGSYFAFTDFNLANPVEHINQEVLGDKEHLTLINGSADYSITHDLKIGILGSADLNAVASAGFIPTFPIEGNASATSQSDEKTHSYNANVHINYDKTFGKSVLSLLGAYEYNDHSYDFNYASTYANAPGSSGSAKMDYKLRSIITRAAYNYDELFYATAILREDAQSGQHGYFPSLSLAYRLKKDLFANAGWISDMKLRAGYGLTGNSTAQYSNPTLQWEKIHGTNIGLDFSLFKGRLSGDINYFNGQTKNSLVLVALPSPPFAGNSTLANIGSLTNKGFEVSLSGLIISGHKLNWTAYGQITFMSTTTGNLAGQYTVNGQSYPLNASQTPEGYAEGRGLNSNPITFLKSGYGPYVFYLPHYTGVDAQGNQTFDGKTIPQNSNPQRYYTDPSPKFNYGITNSFDFGNWSLSFAMRGVYGQKIFNNTLLDIETITRLPQNNVTKEALTNGLKDAPVASDKWLENASFLRLDNATLGYSFKKVSFASVLRVFIAANNLFVITGYKGLDPEVRTQSSASGNVVLFGANTNGAQNQPYIDANYNGQGYYPIARTFSLGVNVSLK